MCLVCIVCIVCIVCSHANSGVRECIRQRTMLNVFCILGAAVPENDADDNYSVDDDSANGVCDTICK